MVAQKDVFYMTDENQDWVFSGLYPSLDNTTHAARVGIPFCYYSPIGKRLDIILEVSARKL